MTMNQINEIPEDQWGVWCAHGKRIIEPANTDSDYPPGKPVDPWACSECTPEQFADEMTEVYYDSQRGGIEW